MVKSAADLRLNPLLLNKQRRESPWTRPNELEEGVLTAWLDQVGDECASCGKLMEKNGRPNEQPVLSYIRPLNDGGNKKLDNIECVCASCAEKSR